MLAMNVEENNQSKDKYMIYGQDVARASHSQSMSWSLKRGYNKAVKFDDLE